MAAAPQQQPQQPSSSAAASTEQRAPLFSSGVLPVMLQHPDISSDCENVCRLLCSSKALRSAVLQHASGMVELRLGCEDRRAQRYCCWLSRHGRLLKALMLEDNLSLADAASLACGLQVAAAAAPGGLRLQELEVGLSGAMAGLVLQQLPAQHLTRLDLTTDNAGQLPGAAAQQPDPCVQLTAQALAGLTNLSYLWLGCELEQPSDEAPAPVDAATMDAFVPALSALSRLTKLSLSGCSKGALSLLPQQLLELVVFQEAAQPSEQLQLGHLTVLTRLQYVANAGQACGVQAGDVLPPNLLSLEVGNCSTTGPLAALTRLTCLELQHLSASMSVAGLVSGIAGRLQQVQEMRVDYDYREAAAAAAGPAAVWPAAATAAVLPALRELVICQLPGSILLGAADAISRMCALTRLDMYQFDGNGQDGAAIDALAQAIAGLPNLQVLALSRVALRRSPAAVKLLSAAATSLTTLSLSATGLTDHSVSRMFAFGLTGLRSLKIYELAVSVPSLLLIVGCLPHLTALDDLSETDGSSVADNECMREIDAELERRRQAAAQ